MGAGSSQLAVSAKNTLAHILRRDRNHKTNTYGFLEYEYAARSRFCAKCLGFFSCANNVFDPAVVERASQKNAPSQNAEQANNAKQMIKESL
jgi:hypothetical protein